MHNNEFEKRMEHKLEELKFTPSDAVWQKVEVQIRERKRRRRFFFWWLPAIVLCTGITGWFIYSWQQKGDQANISIATAGKKTGAVSTAGNHPALPEAHEKTPVENKSQPVTENVQQAAQVPVVAEVKTGKPQMNMPVAKNHKQKHTTKPLLQQVILKEEKPAVAKINRADVETVQPVMMNEPATEKKRDTINTFKQDEQTQTEKTVTSSSTGTMQAPVAQKPVVSKKKQNEFTAVLRIGMSDMSRFSEGLSKNENLFASPGTSVGGGTGYTAATDSSNIKTGFGFSAGVQLKRPLAKRSAISIGLAYAYYSSSHKTGATVYSIAQFSNDVRNTLVNNYAMVGNAVTYSDRYHFIEIPLLYHLQLNKADKRPVTFNGGIVYSYLLGSNAQYYYKATGAYYYDRLLFSRSQLQLRTGFSLGLMKKLNYPLQVGVQYQYGLSGQWKSSLDLNQHLSFTGVQLSWRLNKK